jgi:hypothetical protein
MLRIGRTVLALEQPVNDALARIEEAPDERMEVADELATGTITSAIPQSLVATGSPPTSSDLNEASAVAPKALIANAASRPSAGRRGRWSVFDVLVVIASLAVLALSLVGLVWLLRS